jgi:hypothetical protein
VPTTGKGSDHYPVSRIELIDHGARDVAQPTGHPVPLHGAPNRLRNDQPDPRTVLWAAADRSQRMHDEIGLHRSHPVTDGRTELR